MQKFAVGIALGLTMILALALVSEPTPAAVSLIDRLDALEEGMASIDAAVAELQSDVRLIIAILQERAP